ncbi:hypothetical protein F4678DRAFT_418654 [Xylaria arbuscula]|nr:hypothetical protein F4678DRAFT_418654 [Xylaria arbuscula]
MAERRGPQAYTRRAPLGDATDRVINASPQKRGKHGRPPNPQPNPLRAHPTNLASSKYPASRKHAAASIDNPVSNLDGRAVSSNANPRISTGPYAVTPGVKETNGDQRASLISTSSGASSGNRKTHIGPWQLGKTLGKGSAARVRLARHHTTQDIVAVKILAKNMTQLTAAGSMAELEKWDRTRDEFNSQRQMPLSIEREVAVLKLIDHPHIVKLHDIWENRAEIYLVLEYMDGGDMFSYINICGPIPEFEMVGYFRQIVSALEYVHSFNICHRDLKPENILMKSNGVVKIADFGMAAIQQSPTHSLRTSCGSPHYAAPELIARARYQGNKVDIWSLGCVLYATLSRQLPFDDPNGNVPKLLAKAAKGIYTMPEFLSKEAKDLISKMLTVDPKKRISIRKIWEHPLLQKYDDLHSLHNEGLAPDCRASDKSRPVPPEELDLQILRQLKAMWHTFTEKEIAMQLCNPLPNDQKFFYWLLYNYREKKLENYDMDLTYSASDYHHLRPVNWRKKFTTAEFPSRYRRVPSRFTVISTVPTDGSFEIADNVTDGGTTTRSYDPYKSSRIIENVYASHAKIVIHRNGSTTNRSNRSTLRRGQSGSCKSTSTRSRQTRGGRHIVAPPASRASRHSLSSIQSGDSTPYTRPASRRKRRIDFSHIRMQSGTQREVAHDRASIAGDDVTRDYGYTSPARSFRDPRSLGNSNGRTRQAVRSMANMSEANHGSPIWNEEVVEFSHSIAKDCDNAFNSSLLIPESHLGNTPDHVSGLADTTLLPNRLATPTPAPKNKQNIRGDAHPWDRRPLPPTPSTTASALDEHITGKRMLRDHSENWQASSHITPSMMPRTDSSPAAGLIIRDDPNRRIVSAPIYSQYSTQWGKDKIPLPSIHEKSKEEIHANAGDKTRIVSAPPWYQKPEANDRADLDFLSRQDHTIRLVTSPSIYQFMGAEPSEPPHARKQIPRSDVAYHQSKGELNLRERYMNDELAVSAANAQDVSEDVAYPTTVKKKASWFKRGSKDKEAVLNSKGGSSSDQIERPMSTATHASSAEPVRPPARKKSFNLAFWRNNKHESQMQMSLAEPNKNDKASSKPTHMFSRPDRPLCDSKSADEGTTRNIDPQQSWLARLFRVKPATKYLCFSISRRRARQEIVILLKEWRKYGIRDVEVDKERNIVFARVGESNCKLFPVLPQTMTLQGSSELIRHLPDLNMKQVAFAAEIMTVIEHGKRGHLCIVRVTQERGAASSFHKVVDTMNSVFSNRGLLVVEKRKIKMMIKTLNS